MIKKTDKKIILRIGFKKYRAVTVMLNSVLWNRQITRKNKLLIYNSIVKKYCHIWKFNKNLESKLMSMEMDFLRRSARFSRSEKIRNNVIREKMNIKNSVLDYIRYKQLNWYDHVRRWTKKGSLEEL